MKHKNIFKSLLIGLLLLLLVALMIGSAAAQEPEANNQSDTEAQMVDFIAFEWDPPSTQVSRGDGSVITRLKILGAQQISGFTLAIAYPASIVAPAHIPPDEIKPGNLLSEFTRGADYFMTITPGGGGLACGGDSSFLVSLTFLKPNLTINGTGNLFEITWRSDPDAAVSDQAKVCLDGAASKVVDNGSVPSKTPVGDTFGYIIIDPPGVLKFHILLEGNKKSGEVEKAVPKDIFTKVAVKKDTTTPEEEFPCDGGSVDEQGFCAFNNTNIRPPFNINVRRMGYLCATMPIINRTDSTSVFLPAGDLNQDNKVDIFDLRLIASLLGKPVGSSTLSKAANYILDTPNSEVIDIRDLVLVAKNFGLAGPAECSPCLGCSD